MFLFSQTSNNRKVKKYENIEHEVIYYGKLVRIISKVFIFLYFKEVSIDECIWCPSVVGLT